MLWRFTGCLMLCLTDDALMLLLSILTLASKSRAAALSKADVPVDVCAKSHDQAEISRKSAADVPSRKPHEAQAEISRKSSPNSQPDVWEWYAESQP